MVGSLISIIFSLLSQYRNSLIAFSSVFLFGFLLSFKILNNWYSSNLNSKDQRIKDLEVYVSSLSDKVSGYEKRLSQLIQENRNLTIKYAESQKRLNKLRSEQSKLKANLSCDAESERDLLEQIRKRRELLLKSHGNE